MLLPASGQKKTYDFPFQDPSLSIEERIDDLLSLLTPEEKIGLLMNKSISVDKLGIPSYNWWSEACHGVRADGYTVYPQTIALGASFDGDLVYRVYETVSDEARANWNRSQREWNVDDQARYYPGNPELSFWCPNINIFRDPRWGRGQETPGEDPYLTSVIGLQTVLGMQGNDPRYIKTHACAKHYAVHSGPEPLRHSMDVSVSMRDLWETYLPAFKTLVVDGNVREVMGAYQRYEGVPCTMSDRLLVDILREKWGYDGLVVTDCDAVNNYYTPGQHMTHKDPVHAAADALKHGTDLECGRTFRNLADALEQNLITVEDLDHALRSVLQGRFELGTLDPDEMSPWKDLGPEVISCEKHHELAVQSAREGMVLLKNDGILPFAKNVKRLAVVGPNADDIELMNGNYGGTPIKEHEFSILTGIRSAFPNTEIVYDKGCELTDEYNTIRHNGDFNGGKGILVEFFNNNALEGEPDVTGYYNDINFSTFGGYGFADGVNTTNISLRATGTYTPDFTGNLKYLISGDNGYKFYVNGELFEEQTGMGRRGFGGFGGRRSPQYKELPVEAGKPIDILIEYVKGSSPFAMFNVQFCERNLADFSALAALDVDAYIVVGGISAQMEGEGGDKADIEVPVVQQRLIKALHATGKPVVLVNCSGSALGFATIEADCNAILQAWYGGEGGAQAIGEILNGTCNPSGKLPVTFYASTDQLPDFMDYNMEGRTYRYFRGKPLYQFGYGLSYTTFAYGKGKLSKKSVKAGKGVTVTVPVTNTGKCAGDEVVQVYVKSLDNPDAPIKDLKGFQRVSLAPGATAKVTIDLAPDAFAYYDGKDGLEIKPGKYQILYGSSSADEDLKALDFQVK
ncbi:MAG: glycoside hydrolase family 3 C-terminal domain-containing protein [Bacteroidales bacterium]|nr:glycoside hydrolase family 3 C-terminal domain-containing protein [Bacteroidales bacterium]